ncbi:GNAT family N-acetyltransferase [archaeon]|nr:GNAT family N-acetyltransferase [archaeon]MBT7282543.1 GNAT family N-acetyltransferase [archaeon]
MKKATKKDLLKMLEIIKTNNPKYPKQLVHKELKEMFSESLLRPTYFVAENKKEIVALGGFISSWVDNAVFNIFWMNTNSKYQKQGIGTKLMKELINQIKKQKKPKSKIILISTEIPKFYKKFGFKKINSRYDGNYLLMEKRLK